MPSGNGENPSKYEMQRSTDNSTWTTINSALTGTSSKNEGLATGTTYYYRMRAYNAAGWGSYGSSVSGKTFALPGKPVPTVTAGTKQLVISWSAVNGDGQTVTYEVYEGSNKISGSAALTSTSFTHDKLENKTTHTYTVKAITAAGSVTSNTVSGTTNNVPGEPTDLKATVKDVKTIDGAKKAIIEVTWNAPQNNGGATVTGYDVTWFANGTNLGTERVSGTTFTKEGFALGTQYTFYVAAVNAAGSGESVYETSSMVTTWNVPDPVTNVTNTSESGSVTLNWNAPASPNGREVTSYAIYIYEDKDKADIEDQSGLAKLPANPIIKSAAEGTAKTITGLQSGNKYYVRISASNEVGESPRSSTYQLDAKDVPSKVSSAEVTVVNDTTIKVTWPAANANGSQIDYYTVEAWDVAADRKVGSTTFTDGVNGTTTQEATIAELTTYREYQIIVTAHNGMGTSPEFRTSSYRTMRVPFEPTQVSAKPTDRSGEIRVTWEPPADNGGSPVTAYYVYRQTEGGDWELISDGTSLGNSSREYVAKGLTDGQSYVIAVRATNVIGNSLTSDNQATNANNTDTATPRKPAGAPQDVKAVISDGTTAVLAWNAPADFGGSAFLRYIVNIQSAANEEPAPAEAGPVVGTITVDETTKNASVTVTGLTMGERYTFQVHAVTRDGDAEDEDLSGADAVSNAVVMWRLPDAPSTADMTAAPTNETGEVALTWLYPGDDGDTVADDPTPENHTQVTKYAVYYRENTASELIRAGEIEQVRAEDGAPQPMTYTVTGLKDGTQYAFVVAAVNGAGEGAQSQPILNATPRRVPEAPALHGNAVLDENELWNGAPYGAVSGDRQAVLTAVLPAQDVGGKLGNGGDPIVSYKIYATEANAIVQNGFVTAAAAKDGAQPQLMRTVDVQGFTAEQLADTLKNVVVPGLENGKDYILTVSAVNGAGEGAVSQTAGVRVGMPETPENLALTLGTSEASASNLLVQVGYDEANGNGSPVTGYEVEVKSSEGTVYGEGGILSYPSTSNIFTGSMFGETLTMRVRAVSDIGKSTWSAPRSVVVGAPEIPEITGTVMKNDSIDLSWNAVSNNGSRIVRYLVYLDGALIKTVERDDAGFSLTGGMSVNIPKNGAGNAHNLPDGTEIVDYTEMTAGHAYRLEVAAQNVAGVSPKSRPVTVTFGVPQAPAVGGTQFLDGGVLVYWTAPEDNGGSAITRYNLYANGDRKAVITLAEHAVSSLDELKAAAEGEAYFFDDATNTYYAIIRGLANGVDYNVQVSASNANGEGALSGANNNATPAKLPEAPRNLTATPVSDTKAKLTWLAPSYNGGDTIQGYVVKAYYEDGTIVSEARIEVPGIELSAEVSGLRSNATYYFTVHAYNKVNKADKDTYGNPAKSNLITTFTVPGKPVITKLESIAPDVDSKSNWSVRVTWQPPESDGGTPITGYKVYSGTVLKSGSNPLTSTSFVISGMEYNKLYDKISVVAVNSVGTNRSEYGSIRVGQLVSPEVTEITTQVPTNEQVDTKLSIRWNAVEGLVDGFRVFVLPESVQSTDEADSYIRSHTPHITTNELSGTIEGYYSGTNVRFCVVAYNAEMGNSPVSKIYEAVIGATSAPQAVSVTPGKEQATVTWAAPADLNNGELTGYEVFRDGVKIAETGADAAAYVVTGLKGGESYRFAVRAVSTQSNRTDGVSTVSCVSQLSPAKTANPWSTPTAPLLRDVAPQDGSFQLTFSTANGNGLPVTVSNYDVYLRGAADTDAEPQKWSDLIFQENADGTVTVTVGGVTNGKEYYVYVVAWTQYSSASEVNYSAAPDLSADADIADKSKVQTVTTGVLAAPEITGIVAGAQTATITYTAPEDSSNTLDKYIVSYWTGEDEAKTVESTTTSCQIPGLTPGLLYKVTVCAHNTNGNGASSAPVEVRVGTPLAPTMNAPAGGDKQATISWNPPTSHNGNPVQMYKVYMTDEHGGTSFVYADAGRTTTVLNDLQNGVRYRVEVAAINACGEGARSESIEVTPGTAPGKIDAPTVTATALSAESVQLTWSEPSDTGGLPILGYVIEGEGLAEAKTVTDTNAVVDGLQKGKTYVFTIRAKNAVGMSEAVKTPSVATLTEPGSPAWRSLTSANSTFNAKWEPPALNGGAEVLEYRITVYKAGEQTAVKTYMVTPSEGNTDSNAGTISYMGEVGSFEIGTEYDVTIEARNSVDWGKPSSRLSIIITGEVASSVPGKPYNVTATAGNAKIDVSWTKPLYDGNLTIDGYRVYYYETGNKDATQASVWVSGSGTTSTTLKNLKNDVSYTTYVVANNSLGDSVPSDEATAKPYFIPAPETPTNLRYKNNNTYNMMTILWDAAENTGAPGEEITYNVYINNELRSSGSSATSLTFEVPQANVGALYNIQVEAVSTGGVSGKAYIKARSTLNVMSQNVGEPDTNHDEDYDGELDEVEQAKVPGAPMIDTEQSKMFSGSKKLHIEWNAPSDNGGAELQGYKLYINSSKGNTVYDFGPETGGEALDALAYDHQIEAGVIYNVRISAYNEVGEGAYSDPLQMYLAASNAPTDLTAEKTSKTGITLKWSAPNSGDAVSYYKLQINGADQETEIKALTYNHIGSVNTNYIFRVYAVYVNGDSTETSKTTDAVRVSTMLLTPAAPTELTAEAEKNGAVPTGNVTLRWNASAHDTADTEYSQKVTGYQVYVNGAAVGNLIPATEATEYQYTYAGEKEQDYIFHVVAVNASGNVQADSVKSNVVSASTAEPKAGAPTQITDLAVSAEQSVIDDKNASVVPITLTWSPSTLAEAPAVIVMEEEPQEIPADPQPVPPTAPETGTETGADPDAKPETDPTPPADGTETAQPDENNGQQSDGTTSGTAGEPAGDVANGTETGETVEVTDSPTPQSDSVTELKYAIFYSLNGGAMTEIVTLTASDLTTDGDGKLSYVWNDTLNGAPARGEYTFVIEPRASIVGNDSYTPGLRSNSASISTLRVVPAPQAPTNVKAEFTPADGATKQPEGTVSVTWTAPEGEVESYKLYLDGSDYTANAVPDGTSFTFPATDTKFIYAIQVSATNDGGESALSEVCQLNIPQEGEPDLTPPQAAGAVKFVRAASNGADEIRLFWTASDDPQVLNYQVYVDGKQLVDAEGNAIVLDKSTETYTFGGKTVTGEGKDEVTTLHPFYVLEGDAPVAKYVTAGTYDVQVEAVKYFSPTQGTLTDLTDMPADTVAVPGMLSNEEYFHWVMTLGLNIATNTTDDTAADTYWVADTNIDANGDGTRDTMGTIVRLTGKVTATGSAAAVAPEVVLKDAYGNEIKGAYDAETETFSVEVALGMSKASDEIMTMAEAGATDTYTLTVTKKNCTSYTVTNISLDAAQTDVLVGDAVLYVGDVNGDDKIDFQDLIIVNSNYNREANDGEILEGDANCDGVVDFQDMILVNSSYNQEMVIEVWGK